jgi:hypothetical protein
MPSWKSSNGNWTDFRKKFNLTRDDELDLHLGRRDPSTMTYWEAMAGIEEFVLAALQSAQNNGRPHIMFLHGRSTSRPGSTTARSVVRRLMRSSEATPYIERSGCIQHESVFVAKIKPKRE